MKLVFETEIISYHRNEFRICGLTSIILNSVAEIRIERVHVAPVPRDLDGVADGSFDSRRCGLVFLCDGGVENLGDRVDNLAVVYCHDDCGAEILISLDVGGDFLGLFFTGFIALFIGVNS